MLMAAASIALLVAAILIACLLPQRGAVAWVVSFGLLAWGLCVATVAVAGIVVGDLSGLTLFLLSCAWLAVAALIVWRRDQPSVGLRLRAALVAIWRALSWPPAAAAAVIVALSLATRVVLAVRLPVADLLGWQYHLVFVDVWLQANRIVGVPQNQWTDGWPAAGELLTTWLAAFDRSDALTGFTGLLPIPIAMVACIGLARSFGASRATALLAGLLFGMTPAMLALAGTTYVDTAFTAAVAAAWWYGLRMIGGERDASAALLFGIATGLALGIKGTSFVLVLPLLATVGMILLVDAVRGISGPVRRWTPSLSTVALAVPVLVLGVSWYLKNLLVHGNPVYPIGIGPFEGLEAGSYGAPPEPDALRGLAPIAQVAISWAHDWQLDRYLFNQRPGGFGHAWLALAALAAVGLLLLVKRRQWAALLLVIAPVILALAVLTSPWYARYTLFVPVVALPLAALTLDRLSPAIRTAAAFVLVGLAAISVVLVNAFPNVTLPIAPGGPERAAAYWAAVVDESDPLRDLLAAPPSCREAMPELPAGARVAVAKSFFTPHAVVGSDLRATLIEPPPQAGDPESLLAQLRDRNAGWLVTRRASGLDRIASQAGDDLVLQGDFCANGRLWLLRQEAPG
jgi:hypothetical protein